MPPSEEDDQQVALPLIRGTDEYADCCNCPFSKDGLPNRPVYGEGPEHPKWIVVGEGPGGMETRFGRPFVGPTGEALNKALFKIGRRRTIDEPSQDIWFTNSTLCQPSHGLSERDRQQAVQQAQIACNARLKAELAQFPGRPILTLGAHAARAVIPKEALDAIDPPDSAKVIRKQRKDRQEPGHKSRAARRKAIGKLSTRRLAKMIKHHRKALTDQVKKQHKRLPDERWLEQETNRVRAQFELKARGDAIKEYDLKAKERELKRIAKLTSGVKPKKAKPKTFRITDICGSLFDVDVDGTGVRAVIPAIHPAALLRGGGASIAGSHTPDMAFVNLIYDASKIDALASGRDVRLTVNAKWALLDEAGAVDLFLRVFRSAMDEGACTLDLETFVDDNDRHHALMSYVARIKVIGLATKELSVSILWDLLPDWTRPLLQLLLASVKMCFHNGLYDRVVLQNKYYGFWLPDEHDCTLLGHHAAFPGCSHRLQTVTAQFFGVGPWKAEFRNASDDDLEKLAAYNAKDSGATHAVREPIFAYIKRHRVEQVYEIDKKMACMAGRMHLAGMPIDREINAQLMSTFSKNVLEARRAVEDTARDPKRREQIWHYLAIGRAGKRRKLDPADFEERYQIRLSAMKLDPDWRWKIGSGKHIAALLQAMGVELVQRTDKGELSTRKDVLEDLTDVPIVRDILNYRENDKLYSTFVAPIFDRYDAAGNLISYGYADENNRIHPVWNVHRISGRWSSTWPGVSNVPKDKWKKLLGDALLMLLGVKLPDRGLVTLPSGVVVRVNKDKSVSKLTRPNLRAQVRCRRGRKIVGFDYQQIEARVIALISGDPFMCEVFADLSRDIHREVAAVIFDGFGRLDGDTQKQVREQTKPIEYAFMYMAVPETLHKQLLKEGYQIKLVDLVKAYNRLKQLMAGVVAWQRNAVARASRPPFEIRDYVLGRRRVWPMGNVEATEACNAEVQPTAAAIMNLGMAKFMEHAMPQYRELDPLAQVHDAAYFEVCEDDAPRLVADIKRWFPYEHTRDGRTIRFDVEAKIGDSWADV